MFKRNILIVSTLVIASFLAAGCSKKVTKVDAPIEKPAPKPTPVEKPAPVVSTPSDSFKVEDLDAQSREILVPIYFMYDKHDLTPESVTKLEKIAPFIQGHSSLRILIEGNADERGSSEYNVALGESRAQSVKRYLVTYGIGDTRLEVTSYGKERPVNPNCGADDACHAKNRRVEWKLIAK